MPADAAADSWIDMDAVRDKELREEFVSPGPVKPSQAQASRREAFCFCVVEHELCVSCVYGTVDVVFSRVSDVDKGQHFLMRYLE